MAQEYNYTSGIWFNIPAAVLVKLVGYRHSGRHQGHTAGNKKGLEWVLDSALSVLFHCLRGILIIQWDAPKVVGNVLWGCGGNFENK